MKSKKELQEMYSILLEINGFLVTVYVGEFVTITSWTQQWEPDTWARHAQVVMQRTDSIAELYDSIAWVAQQTQILPIEKKEEPGFEPWTRKRRGHRPY